MSLLNEVSRNFGNVKNVLTVNNLVVSGTTKLADLTVTPGDSSVQELSVHGQAYYDLDVDVAGSVTAAAIQQNYQPSGLAALLVPTGSLLQYAGANAPNGWLLCDGSAVSRTSYSALFAAINTAFGVGDGSTTFNLPDFRGRVPLGAGAGAGLTARALATAGGQENISQVPPHTHSITDPGHTHTYYGVQSQGVASGPDNAAENSPRPIETSGTSTTNISVLSTGTNVAGGAVDTMNPFLVITYIIKV